MDLIVAVGTAWCCGSGRAWCWTAGSRQRSLVVFILYLGKMYKPMQELSKMTDAWSKAAVGYERIREVLETDEDVKDIRGARRAPRFKGKIEFEDVSFQLRTATRPILQDVSLTDRAGTGGGAGGTNGRRKDHASSA